MMHGHEKSHSAIVAVKPTNKAERSAAEQSAAEPTAAEPVEPRAETKGNADQQRTRRTQRRISVSQMLARIRRVARERKKERFTSLFHNISIDLLEEAFFELERGGPVRQALGRRPKATQATSRCPAPEKILPSTRRTSAMGPSSEVGSVRRYFEFVPPANSARGHYLNHVSRRLVVFYSGRQLPYSAACGRALLRMRLQIRFGIVGMSMWLTP